MCHCGRCAQGDLLLLVKRTQYGIEAPSLSLSLRRLVWMCGPCRRTLSEPVLDGSCVKICDGAA